MTSYWEVVPALHSMDGFFHRQRRSASIPNTPSTSGRWNSAATHSLSRALCCRLLSCCVSPSVRACRGLILMGQNYRKTIYARRLRSTECLTDDSVDPSTAAAEVCRRVTMGSEATAVDRIEAVHSRLEQYFEDPSAERVFRDTLGVYERSPAAVISKALVAGLNPPDFKLKVEHLRGAWKDKPKEVFDLVWEVAVEWRTVEIAAPNTYCSGVRAGSRPRSRFPAYRLVGRPIKASTVVVTCFECRKPGHLARNCPLYTFPSTASSPPAGGRRNGGHGASTGHGRPPRPAQQQRPAAQGVSTSTSYPAYRVFIPIGRLFHAGCIIYFGGPGHPTSEAATLARFACPT